ncbi:transcription termination factor MTERF2, chloroplastic [Abrus precatorius]|uniref:Transcription termination factor MTERF2, chloroplastic n=1 Tax=Abrus precatorius TaxID=3816 RepID=A0A8B8KDT6_ABRPR|nr:transcription termination factor MTERF2, chloroplastic [Abrus precatorius]
MLVQIHRNWFLPVPVAFAHKMEVNKCVIWKHPPIEDGRRRRKRRRRNWRCGSGEAISEWEVEEAGKAVSSYLEELGVSEENSVWIASKSRAYVKMLVEGVRDLEQWDEQIAGLSFKEKIINIATKKGEKGKVAYLETLGLSLSSSMNVARYLSADTLPSLINKVTRMKQLLFSADLDDCDYFRLFIKNTRLMMRHLSISIDEDLQHTLSFLEKVEARRGGLNILASRDSAFHYLIESFPRLLQLSVNDHFARLLDFLHNIGIPVFRIPYIILAFPPLLFWNPHLLKTRILSLNQIDIVDEDYAKLLLKYPWILSTSIQRNYTEVLAFLYSLKVPTTWIDRAIESQPHLLGCSTSKLKLMVDQFAELGVQGKKLNRVIAKSPQLLLRKPEDFLQIVLFFENMDFDKETVGRILARCPEIFAASINNTLQRKIEFLGGVGVSKTFLCGVIRKYPELLVSDTDTTLLQRVLYLMKLGLSEKDIAFMVRTFSPLLGYSIDGVLKPKIEFLVNSMERPVRDVVGYPRYFSYSLAKKIKPRYWVLKGRNIKCSLKDMLGKNDEEFAAEFMDVGRMLVYPPVPSSNDSL